ncbi:hypothetical protein ITJ64_01700 [Herbiconiux sp. VKM Ac-1786]|uniref:hypothetical protein n=1 Tax=Herbiconiux sp. VKM Ac-1786 TaxID=2783824 RepID=UPI00188C8A44|nr:hypothetical protein [Herbiconiux sp. VKM Ac-1786]MBF4571225.1 hypothetical protein [Herbiconiux sp. VKM Ac-1786]
MAELTSFDRLPWRHGDTVDYEHRGKSYFLAASNGTTWVLGDRESGRTLAILRLDENQGPPLWTLRGPSHDLAGESWMLLLAAA